MALESDVARHYTHSDLTATVLDALRRAGADVGALRTTDISGVDEFHTGWRPLTIALSQDLAPPPGTRLLDVGAGIGGPARHFAETYRCQVTGIDITQPFVELANELTARTGLADRARFVQGSALAMPFAPGAFDLAIMFHVGMNIADKAGLFAEVARVLMPGGRFVVYDQMRVGEGPLPWSMPWADDETTSFVETPARYRALLEAAGFRIEAERDWSELVLEATARMRERLAAEGVPVVGLHLLMGPAGMDRLRRVGESIRDGLLAPVQLTAALPA